MELGNLLRYEGYTPKLEELQHLEEEFDVDGSGEIGMREFFKIMRTFREDDIKEFSKLFKQHDIDGGGDLSTAEIAGVLRQQGHTVSLPIVTQAVQMVDADGSGSIDFDEFVDLMDIYRKAVLKETRKKC